MIVTDFFVARNFILRYTDLRGVIENELEDNFTFNGRASNTPISKVKIIANLAFILILVIMIVPYAWPPHPFIHPSPYPYFRD